jgi:negative regulator of sigma-B (phosphoserine phosphatase)
MEAIVSTVEWAVATASAHADEPSGDAWLVRARHAGALIAVLDGVGHGSPAAEAAAVACGVLVRCTEAPLADILERGHTELQGRRGIALGLAAYHPDRSALEWLAVGNIQGFLTRHGANGRSRTASLIVSSGIVGRSVPMVRSEIVEAHAGDLLTLATDGLRPAFADVLPLPGTLQATADGLMRAFRRGHDDALALVARLSGGVE